MEGCYMLNKGGLDCRGFGPHADRYTKGIGRYILCLRGNSIFPIECFHFIRPPKGVSEPLFDNCWFGPLSFIRRDRKDYAFIHFPASWRVPFLFGYPPDFKNKKATPVSELQLYPKEELRLHSSKKKTEGNFEAPR